MSRRQKKNFHTIETDLVTYEKEKIKGAVRTDFILSAEIVVISLGTVATATFMSKLTVLSIIAIVMTIGVYGFVGLIVKIDDIGLYLTQQSSNAKQKVGRFLLAFAPKLMKIINCSWYNCNVLGGRRDY